MESCDPVDTLMEINDKLDLDQHRSPVDATKYRSMIGALMYLTYPLAKEVLSQMLELKLETEEESSMALELIKFVKQQLEEFEDSNDDDSVTSDQEEAERRTISRLRLIEILLIRTYRIFRYLRGTVNTGLWYTKDSGFKLTGFSDVDYAGCKDTFKSTSSGAQFLGEKLLTDYGFHFNKIPIYCDSKSAIAISCNPVQHSRMKHIVVCYHFIKEQVEKGTIELYFVKTDYQLADIFTKALPVDRFKYLVRHLGMRSLSPQELDRLAKP
ncbi:hypothetical protein Tco_0473883 [Tanacetum coccineum]